MNMNEFKSTYDKIALSSEFKANMLERLRSGSESAAADPDEYGEVQYGTEIKFTEGKRRSWKTAAIGTAAAAVICVGGSFAAFHFWGNGIDTDPNPNTSPDTVYSETGDNSADDGETSELTDMEFKKYDDTVIPVRENDGDVNRKFGARNVVLCEEEVNGLTVQLVGDYVYRGGYYDTLYAYDLFLRSVKGDKAEIFDPVYMDARHVSDGPHAIDGDNLSQYLRTFELGDDDYKFTVIAAMYGDVEEGYDTTFYMVKDDADVPECFYSAITIENGTQRTSLALGLSGDFTAAGYSILDDRFGYDLIFSPWDTEVYMNSPIYTEKYTVKLTEGGYSAVMDIRLPFRWTVFDAEPGPDILSGDERIGNILFMTGGDYCNMLGKHYSFSRSERYMNPILTDESGFTVVKWERDCVRAIRPTADNCTEIFVSYIDADSNKPIYALVELNEPVDYQTATIIASRIDMRPADQSAEQLSDGVIDYGKMFWDAKIAFSESVDEITPETDGYGMRGFTSINEMYEYMKDPLDAIGIERLVGTEDKFRYALDLEHSEYTYGIPPAASLKFTAGSSRSSEIYVNIGFGEEHFRYAETPSGTVYVPAAGCALSRIITKESADNFDFIAPEYYAPAISGCRLDGVDYYYAYWKSSLDTTSPIIYCVSAKGCTTDEFISVIAALTLDRDKFYGETDGYDTETVETEYGTLVFNPYTVHNTGAGVGYSVSNQYARYEDLDMSDVGEYTLDDMIKFTGNQTLGSLSMPFKGESKIDYMAEYSEFWEGYNVQLFHEGKMLTTDKDIEAFNEAQQYFCHGAGFATDRLRYFDDKTAIMNSYALYYTNDDNDKSVYIQALKGDFGIRYVGATPEYLLAEPSWGFAANNGGGEPVSPIYATYDDYLYVGGEYEIKEFTCYAGFISADGIYYAITTRNITVDEFAGILYQVYNGADITDDKFASA